MKDIKCNVHVDGKQIEDIYTKVFGIGKDKETPLLQIELADINSVPTVFYKGEEIKGRSE